MIHLKQKLQMGQSFVMTARMKQSIKLLTLPCQELKEVIQNELLENPLLSATDSSFDRRETGLSIGLSSGLVPFETYTAEKTTLKDHLLWQAQVNGISKRERSLLFLLISHLNDRGYLDISLEELAEESGGSEGRAIRDLKTALANLQSMDPPGVGARSLKECLLIQARVMEEDTKDMTALIQNHLHNLEKKNYKAAAFDLKISLEEVKDMAKTVSSMEPVPARKFLQEPDVYVTPDVYIEKEGNDWKVTLNDEGIPSLSLKPRRWSAPLSGRKGKEVKKYLNERLQAGQWFIRALMQRQETIRKVTENLVRRQRDFLSRGHVSDLKPLVLQDVADDVGCHPSTVSRVTSNKYAHTPFGLIPLKSFFSTGIRCRRGQTVPARQIKMQIKKIISAESGEHPLSDSKIQKTLQKDLGVALNRRTVAHYRSSLAILPFSKRKRA